LVISREWCFLNPWKGERNGVNSEFPIDGALTVLEDLVLRQRGDPLLEVAVADGEDGPLLVQERHPGRQHGHLVLQGNTIET
jgi:hypothetical protein